MKNNGFHSSYCANCRKSLQNADRVLFVERELGRCFCNETCIYEYFEPVSEQLLEVLKKQKMKDDQTQISAKKLEEYRSATLSDPDEVWVQKTESGDCYFTYIAEFKEEHERFYHVAVSLVLDGEPSFLLLEFVTQDEDLVAIYRKQEELKINYESADAEAIESTMEETLDVEIADTISKNRTHEEHTVNYDSSNKSDKNAYMREIENIFLEFRKADDIPLNDFDFYEKFIAATLEDPDELWITPAIDKEDGLIQTMISHFSGDIQNPFSLIIGCRGANEIVFAIPTKDPELVAQFRRGRNVIERLPLIQYQKKDAA